MDASLKRYSRAVHMTVALALALPSFTSFGASTARAQEASPGGFSLPAGAPPQQDPPTDVQGPVDSESSPPRRADQPTPSAPSPSLPTIAPVPVPTPQQSQSEPVRTRETPQRAPERTVREQRQPAPAETRQAAPAPDRLPQDNAPDPVPATQAPEAAPLPVPGTPNLPAPILAPEAEAEAETGTSDESIWWWLAAGLVALISLIAMGLRQRSSAHAKVVDVPAPIAPTATAPTPPLRRPLPVAPPARTLAPTPASSIPFGTLQGSGPSFGTPAGPAPDRQPEVAKAPAQPQWAAAPALAPAPTPAPAPASVPEAATAFIVQPPRLLLDYTTLGVDVTLVNAIARFHLGITNMANIPVSQVALHGMVVQARRGMPQTIDPMRGDSLLRLLQTLEDIAPETTLRCEGQMRLPLAQIDPIEMQGRLLFVPVVHIWIGYSGPDGTRYAVTQSFVLGEENSPPGPRVGPLRLDLGPRRFTEVGQRPLQPA